MTNTDAILRNAQDARNAASCSRRAAKAWTRRNRPDLAEARLAAARSSERTARLLEASAKRLAS